MPAVGLGLFGIGLIVGGIFVPDPAYGYPLGTPDSIPSSFSFHGIMHAISSRGALSGPGPVSSTRRTLTANARLSTPATTKLVIWIHPRSPSDSKLNGWCARV